MYHLCTWPYIEVPCPLWVKKHTRNINLKFASDPQRSQCSEHEFHIHFEILQHKEHLQEMCRFPNAKIAQDAYAT